MPEKRRIKHKYDELLNNHARETKEEKSELKTTATTIKNANRAVQKSNKDVEQKTTTTRTTKRRYNNFVVVKYANNVHTLHKESEYS